MSSNITELYRKVIYGTTLLTVYGQSLGDDHNKVYRSFSKVIEENKEDL